MANGARDARELRRLSALFESRPAEDVIRWAVRTFHPRLSLTASMTDAVLIDLCVRVEPSVDVVFIDTGYHFEETLDTLETVRNRYRLNLRVMRPEPPDMPVWVADPENCCSTLKVGQLDLALVGKEAWMTGVRRADGPSRATTPVIGRDCRGLVKVSPLATWSDADVDEYIRAYDVPVNPLVARGYRSIGCRPCTRPVEDGAPSRAGRWPGLEKKECGLHA